MKKFKLIRSEVVPMLITETVEIEAKYDKLYESYLDWYNPDILKRREFFTILDKYFDDLPKDYELEYFETDWYSFEEQLIVDIIQENCTTVYDISIDGNRIEFEDIKSISQKDFDFIINFCNKYNLDIVNIDDREDDE